jgi:hypothetical protein
MEPEHIHSLPEETRTFLAEMPPEHRENIMALFNNVAAHHAEKLFSEDFDVYKWYVEQVGEEYFLKRETTNRVKESAADRFERSILGFSVGAIALSITFLQVVGEPVANITPLFITWGSFGLAATIMLIHLVFTQYALAEQVASYDSQYDAFAKRNALKEKVIILDESKRAGWVKWTNRSYWMSIILFLVGVASFAVFALENVPQYQESGAVEEGSAMPMRETGT